MSSGERRPRSAHRRPALVRGKPFASRAVLAVAAAALFFVVLAALLTLGVLHILVVGAYGLFSAVAFVAYAADKSAARQGRWRTPESTLHTIALVGGWPGALAARQVFRHKTTKQPFRTIFWGTVIANCAVLAWLVHAAPLSMRR